MQPCAAQGKAKSLALFGMQHCEGLSAAPTAAPHRVFPPRASHAGPVSKQLTLQGTNLTLSGGANSGLFTYAHQLEALEAASFTLRVQGALVATRTLNVTAVAPAAVDFPASVAAAQLRPYGAAARVNLTAGGTVRALLGVGHAVFVAALRPVGLFGGERFGSDPGLQALVQLVGPTGAVVAAFNGSWSRSNQSYVAFVRATAAGLYNVTLTLRHPTSPNSTVSARLHHTHSGVQRGRPGVGRWLQSRG